MDTKHTLKTLKLEIARNSPDSEPFGFAITVEGKAVPVASCGVYVGGKPAILGPDFRRLPFASEHFTPDELIAYARVMSAAPDLLRELTALIDRAEFFIQIANQKYGNFDAVDELANARAAVTKAEDR